MVSVCVCFFFAVLFGFSLCDDAMPVSMDQYFQLNGDLTKVTWSHAVNSLAKLEEALKGSVMMLEADVILGRLEGSANDTASLPVMGHPPASTSDLSLEQFVNKVMSSGQTKGIKLDFKSKEVFMQSENILEGILNKEEANFPVWLNADILPGPVNSETVPVDADYFLKTSVTKFPTATLSVGWTTNYGGDITVGNYSTENIDNMTDALNRNHVTKPVTFPVRAALAAQSHSVLSALVQSSTSGTTLTVWSPATDRVDYAALRRLVDAVGRDKVYIDMPQAMADNVELKSGGAALAPGVMLASLLVLAGYTQ